MFARRVVVGDRQRQYRAAGFNGRLQQGGMKSEQMGSVSGRAFGENGDVPARIEQRVNLGIDHLCMAATAAAQEDRVVPCRQPADEGPVADFGFGDKRRRTQRVDDEDVEPGNVVGDDQASRWCVGRCQIEAYCEDAECLMRPALFQASPSLFVNPGINQRCAGGDPRKMQGQAQTAVGPYRE